MKDILWVWQPLLLLNENNCFEKFHCRMESTYSHRKHKNITQDCSFCLSSGCGLFSGVRCHVRAWSLLHGSLWLMPQSSNRDTQEHKLLERWERKRKRNALQSMITHPLLVYMHHASRSFSMVATCPWLTCPFLLSRSCVFSLYLTSLDQCLRKPFIQSSSDKSISCEFCLGNDACYSPLLEIHSECQLLSLRPCVLLLIVAFRAKVIILGLFLGPSHAL